MIRYGLKVPGAATMIATALLAGAAFDMTHAGENTIIIDPPGAIATSSIAINDRDVVAGDYTDEMVVTRVFIRTPKGSLKTFRVINETDTRVTALNNEGAIAGTYTNRSGNFEGFVRDAAGKVETFKITGLKSKDTQVVAMNDSGTIVGRWNSFPQHGFIRSADGTLTKFDAPGALETFPASINADGDVAGSYSDGHQNGHGFVRSADGAFTSFDAVQDSATTAECIDDSGNVYGVWYDGSDVAHGFIRQAGGTIETFDLPDNKGNAAVRGVDRKGSIYGYYVDTSGVSHGFKRRADGKVVTFDVPGFTDTTPAGVNARGSVTGSVDSPTFSGFLRVRDKN